MAGAVATFLTALAGLFLYASLSCVWRRQWRPAAHALLIAAVPAAGAVPLWDAVITGEYHASPDYDAPTLH